MHLIRYYHIMAVEATEVKKAFSITIEKDLYYRLKEMAEKEGRTLSNLIEFLLRKAVEDSKST